MANEDSRIRPVASLVGAKSAIDAALPLQSQTSVSAQMCLTHGIGVGISRRMGTDASAFACRCRGGGLKV